MISVTVENGKIVEMKDAGKVLAMRDLNKAQNSPLWYLYSEGSYVAVNPFTGVRKVLNGFEYSVYQFCTRWYLEYERMAGRQSLPIQVYDGVKMLLYKSNPEAYMDLLD